MSDPEEGNPGEGAQGPVAVAVAVGAEAREEASPRSRRPRSTELRDSGDRQPRRSSLPRDASSVRRDSRLRRHDVDYARKGCDASVTHGGGPVSYTHLRAHETV